MCIRDSVQTGRRAAGQVGGHDDGAAAVEGERGGRHPGVPQWQQSRDPGGLLGEQSGDRVGPVRGLSLIHI